MKDYSKLSDTELIKEYEKLTEAKEQDNAMDGSGELGHIIAQGYQPYLDAISEELGKRDIRLHDADELEMPY